MYAAIGSGMGLLNLIWDPQQPALFVMAFVDPDPAASGNHTPPESEEAHTSGLFELKIRKNFLSDCIFSGGIRWHSKFEIEGRRKPSYTQQQRPARPPAACTLLSLISLSLSHSHSLSLSASLSASLALISQCQCPVFISLDPGRAAMLVDRTRGNTRAKTGRDLETRTGARNRSHGREE